MKKIFYCLAVITMVCGFIACGNSKAPVEEQTVVENVEEEVTDIEDEVSEGAARGATDSEGFGRCAESGCYCKAFKGRGQTCQNCGHAYKRHY